MSIGSALARPALLEDADAVNTLVSGTEREITVEVSQRRDRYWVPEAAWQPRDAMLQRRVHRVPLSGTGQDRPMNRVLLGDGGADNRTQPRSAASKWVMLVPGMAVRTDEYEERFGGVDLDRLRTRMTPELFAAFVRQVGTVTGRADMDVTDFADSPEDR
jgi:hypothetical protein